MTFNDRQESILRTLRTTGEVEVDVLAREWSVTTQTVRRDLSELCEAGLAIRTHGGAKKMNPGTAVAYEDRQLHQTRAKSAVAEAAAALIPNRASLFISIGTTTELVAEALQMHQDLTILSNNVNVVPLLRSSRIRSLILLGGEVRLSDGAVVGSDAIRTIANYKADFAIIGTSSLDPDGSVLDFDEREVSVARAMLENARQKILVADVSKFEVTAPYKTCNARDLDFVVLNAEPPESFRASVPSQDTDMIIAGEEHV